MKIHAVNIVESLAADVEVGIDRSTQDLSVSCEQVIAESVLASPELQSMKFALERMSRAMSSPGIGRYDTPRQVLVNYGLRDHVIDWVLS